MLFVKEALGNLVCLVAVDVKFLGGISLKIEWIIKEYSMV